MASDHAIKVVRILEELTNSEKSSFGQIEEKDEIIMLN